MYMGCVTKETPKKDTVYIEINNAIEHFYTLFKHPQRLEHIAHLNETLCQCKINYLQHLLQNFCW